jgi:D-3-phosphoglycerate dehydrogenase / 2-oxoglutarate reductase
MKILIISPIDSDALKRLEEHHDVICEFDARQETLKPLIQDREVVIFRSGLKITAELMESAPDLKLLLRAGSGIDNLDLDYADRRGLEVVRIPGPGAKAVAEMSFAFMLALARRVVEADRLTRQGRWAKHELTGHLLTGKVLGVVGAGNIGTRVGWLGAAWGMEVLGCVEHPSPTVSVNLAEAGIQLSEFGDVLARADFVSLHVPLKASTKNMIDANALARMKQGAFLINLARGGVVDETALYQALVNGHVTGAALDVHAVEGQGEISPLAELPNVILTPHIGAGTYDSQREIGEIILNTIATHVAQQTVHAHANGHNLDQSFQ